MPGNVAAVCPSEVTRFPPSGAVRLCRRSVRGLPWFPNKLVGCRIQNVVHFYAIPGGRDWPLPATQRT